MITVKAVRERVEEILERDRKTSIERLDGLLNSGVLALDSWPDNGVLPQLIVCALAGERSETRKPRSAMLRNELANIRELIPGGF